jgi:hypothetical protein
MEIKMSLDTLKGWLEGVAQECGFEATFTDEGVFIVQMENGEILSISTGEEDENNFVMVLPLVSLTGDVTVDSEVMKLSLKANFLQEDTLGGSITIGPIPGTICYVLAHTMEGVDQTGFSQALANFIGTAEYFKNTIGANEVANAEAQEESTANMMQV